MLMLMSRHFPVLQLLDLLAKAKNANYLRCSCLARRAKVSCTDATDHHLVVVQAVS